MAGALREPLFSSLSGSGGGGQLSQPSQRRGFLGHFVAHRRRRSSSGLRWAPPIVAAAVAASVLLLTAALLRGGGGAQGTGAALAGAWRRAAGALGAPSGSGSALKYPVWWFAPFFSGSGYGGEALAYVDAMLARGAFRPEDVWVTHSGDAVAPRAVAAMDPRARALLERQEYARLSKGALPEGKLQRPAIAICHSFPECWARGGGRGRGGGRDRDPPMAAPGCPCPPDDSDAVAYRIGRTMYETAGLPQHLVEHCNAMDEVWVPTAFNRDTFITAGVDPAKLRVVEEGIDLELWDPARFQPLDPLELGPTQLAGPPGRAPLRRTAGSSSGGAAADGEGGGGSLEQDHRLEGPASAPTGGGAGSAEVAGAGSGGDGKAGAPIGAAGEDHYSSRQVLQDAQGAGGPASAKKPFVFLSVFKLEARKGWDVLLDAFLSEFGPDEDVELHILTKPYAGGGKRGSKGGGVEGVMWRWLERAKGLGRERDGARLPRVYVQSGHVSDADYPRLYLGADAVVLPTRGEGWGRPQMEAMALARPLITTDWSGPTAYINDRVAFPLAIEGLSDAAADMNATDPDAFNEWFDGERWARPSTAHLRQLMRRVVTHPKEAAARGRAARAHLAGRFTPDVLAARVRSEVERVQRRLVAEGIPTTRRRGGLAAQRLAAATADVPRPGFSGGGARASSRPLWLAPGAVPRAGAGALGSGRWQAASEDVVIDAVAPDADAPVSKPRAARYGARGPVVDARQPDEDMGELVAKARAAGFSQAAFSGGSAGIDTVRMPLSEVLARLERRAPKTTMIAPAPGGGGGEDGGSGTAAGVGALVAPDALGSLTGSHGDEKEEAAGAADAERQQEGPPATDEDDGSIVLYA